MNLHQIRQLIGQLSGRYDLVDDNTDLADFLINEGRKYLDRNTENQKTWGHAFSYLAINDWYVEVKDCRSIKEVWMANSAGTRWQLEKVNLQDMLSEYLYKTTANLTAGTPLYYSPAITRNMPEGTSLPVGISSYMDTFTSSGYDYNCVLISPIPEEQVLVEIVGLFYSKVLTLDTDTNYWSSQHPNLLVKSALRELEIFNQNASKVELWEKAIAKEMSEINMDLVDEIISEVDQMEG